MNVTLIIIGLYFVLLSFLTKTKNIRSAVVFKFIPFISGAFCVFYAILNMGVIYLK